MGLFFVLKHKLLAEQEDHKQTIELLNRVSEIRNRLRETLASACREMQCPDTILPDKCRELMTAAKQVEESKKYLVDKCHELVMQTERLQDDLDSLREEYNRLEEFKLHTPAKKKVKKKVAKKKR